MSNVVINREHMLDADMFVGLLERSGLAARRPVDDGERIAQMCASANLIVTARVDDTLIGVARSLTDFAYVCYCADLAVDRDYQGEGIGRRLLAQTRALLHPSARLILLAAPGARSYYEHIGMGRIEDCFAEPAQKP